MSKRLCSVWALLTLLCCCHAETVNLTILQTTDLHGSPAIASFAAFIERERNADPELLLVDCGDISRGSFAASLDGGAAMVSVLNSCRYDVWIPGNHEFRIGQEALRRNLGLFTSGDVLAANLAFEPDVAPKRTILPWKMYRRAGLNVAVIGLVSPYDDLWFSPAAYKGVTLGSPATALANVMPEVRKAKPDVILIAGHLDDRLLAGALTNYPDISLLLGGHTHRTIRLQQMSGGAWLVIPPSNGAAMAKITLTYDKDGKRVVDAASVLLYPKEIAPSANMPADWTALQQKALAVESQVVVRLPPGMTLHPYKAPAPEPEHAPALLQDGQPERNEEPEARTAPDRGRLLPMAWLVAQSMAEATGAGAALGSTRSHWIPKGNELTASDFFKMLPNEYTISVLTLAPDQLRSILKEQKDVRARLYGLDPERLPAAPVRVAFDAYDVTGADGAYPVLRTLAESGNVQRVDTALNIRSTLRSLLERLYPAQ